MSIKLLCIALMMVGYVAAIDRNEQTQPLMMAAIDRNEQMQPFKDEKKDHVIDRNDIQQIFANEMQRIAQEYKKNGATRSRDQRHPAVEEKM
jgi:hypothetical protein